MTTNNETGAICADCSTGMLISDGCTKTTIMISHKLYDRIPYAHETRALFGRYDNGDIRPNHRCHDCNAATQKYHHSGCDVEECPRCHRQLISCGCWYDDEIDGVSI